MRSLRRFALATLLAAPCAAGADVLMEASFESLVIAASPQIELSPGESDTYCYYFRSANRGPVPYADVVAHVEGAVVGTELYATHDLLGIDIERAPPTTVSTIACGLFVSIDQHATTIATLLARVPLGGVLQIVEDALGRTPSVIRANDAMFLKIVMSNPSTAMKSGAVTLVVDER